MEFVIKKRAKTPEVKPEVKPEVVKRNWRIPAIILTSLILVSWLICSIGSNSNVGTGDIAVYHTPVTIKADGNVIRVTSSKITDPYIAVYRNEQEVKVDPVYIGDKTVEVELEPAGSYTMLVIGGNSDSIYYNLSTISVTPDVDYSQLGKAVSEYLDTHEIAGKAKLISKLKNLFMGAANKKQGWEEKHTEVYNGVRDILGFDQPKATTDEHLWQALLGKSGVIDDWVTESGIELTNESYNQILIAVADGFAATKAEPVKEVVKAETKKPVKAEPEPAGGIDEATGIPYVENPVTL